MRSLLSADARWLVANGLLVGSKNIWMLGCVCRYVYIVLRVIAEEVITYDERHACCYSHTSHAPHPELGCTLRLVRQHTTIIQLRHSPADTFPESLGRILLVAAQAVVYVFLPICFHCYYTELMVLYCFIFLANIAFALNSCDAEVFSLMPSIAAISLWLLSSMT